MIVALPNLIRGWLENNHLYGYVRIFDRVDFRAIAAVIVSFLFVLLLGRPVIRWLLHQKVGDSPEFYNTDLNRLMAKKANTPTMGGVLITGAILFSTLLLADLQVFYVLLGLMLLIGMGVLGGIDDWLKLTNARRGQGAREGLHAWEKLIFQIGFAFLAGFFVYRWGVENEMTHSFPPLPLVRSFNPRTNEPEMLFQLPAWGFTLLAIMMIAGSSNAVNLTDGMDGLASSLGITIAIAVAVVAGVSGNTDVVVIAIVLAGALGGFLAHNLPPAKIYLGDCGSMVVGLLLATLAIHIAPAPGVPNLTAMCALLFVPLYDTVLAVLRRGLSGKGIMTADRGHIHHRLLDRGLGVWGSLRLLATLSAVAGTACCCAVLLWQELVAYVALAVLTLFCVQL